jgi:hypothetical protein
VEFQTGHALWALSAARVPKSNPQIAKALDYLLRRQQLFGGWMDPLQSYENFRTPFRETQMAILALSAYFPESARAKGWNAPASAKLSDDPVELLRQLDDIWDPAPPELLRQIAAAASSNDALIRQAAVEALGRLARSETTATLSERLGDASKLVQRTAAWALRQIYSRHPEEPSTALANALASADDRTRWGATRVFAQHFAALARRPEIAPLLAGRRRRSAQPDRRYDPAGHGQAAAPLDRRESSRRRVQSGRRKHPLSVQQLGTLTRTGTRSRAVDSRTLGRGGAAGR